MRTVTIKGYICAERNRFADDRVHFTFHNYKPTPDIWPELVVVCEHTMEAEVPDGFDPRAGLIANLEEQKRTVTAAYAAKVKELNEQIAKLQAIEYTEA